MKTFLAVLAIAALIASIPAAEVVPRVHNEYDVRKWPEAKLKLSPAASLKDVFDSGVRPYRFPGLENTTLEVKHLDLRIELGSGIRLPPIDVEVIRIKPFRDGEIATIEGFTPKQTLEQARNEMLKWLPFGENPRTEDDLDEFLVAVKSDFLDFDDPYRGISHGCGVSWNEPGFGTLGGGPRCGFGFRKTASPTHPLRLHFSFSWSLNRPAKDRGSFRPYPIQPPPGYESVDMTAPENFGPDSAAEVLQSQGVDIGEVNGKEGQVNERVAVDSGIEKVANEVTPSEPRSEDSRSKPGFQSRWMFAGVLVIGLLGFWMIVRRVRALGRVKEVESRR